MKKRIISFILAVIMIAGMLPLSAITAFAEEEVQYPIVVTSSTTYSDCTFDLSGKTVSHLFELVPSGDMSITVTFRNVTFKNVSATENGGCVYVPTPKEFGIYVKFYDCTFINCSTTGHGGVFYMENSPSQSEVLVENCTVKNCSANGYGGFMYENRENSYNSIKNTTFVDCHAKYGGAIYYNRGNRNLEINGCKAEACTASEDGGFVYVNNGDANLLINDSEFSGCTAKNGGFLFVNQYGAKTSITNSEIFDCKATAGDGGAIYCYGETLNMKNSVIRTCTASHYGGGLYIPEHNTNAKINKDMEAGAYTVIAGCSAKYGGGAYAADMKWMQNVIFADNHSTYDGGGMYNNTKGDGSTTQNCRFYRNVAGTQDSKYTSGGLCVDDGNGLIKDCYFVENEAYSYAAEFWTDAKIEGCTVTSNFENKSSEAVYDAKEKGGYTFKPASKYSLDKVNDAYEIKTVDDWDALHYMVKCDDDELVRSGNVVLKNDIIAVNPIGQWISDTDKTKAFRGTFDGNGHTVNLVLTDGASNNAFFNFTNGATIKNLTVRGYVKGDSGAAVIIGHAENTVVENCVNYAEIYGTDYIAGIVGWAKNTNISNCKNYGNITATNNNAGGIIGRGYDVTVINCQNNTDITGNENIGGIVGRLTSGSFNTCENYGNISGNQKTGGIIGCLDGEVSLINCLSCGEIKATDKYAGGIIGREGDEAAYQQSAPKALVKNCHSFGSVSANSDAGGITGHSVSDSNYEQCFYDKEKAVGNSLGTGLSTNAMHGIAADESGNLMPYCVNDYIKENDKSKDGWLRAAFDENGFLRFISDAAVMYIGAGGTVNYTENATQVDPSMETLGEKGKSRIYYVNGTVKRNERIQILGNVTLILNDDCYYDVQGGIGLEEGNSLTVTSYSLGEHMGSMKAETNQENKGAAAIGGNAAKTEESLSEGTLSFSSKKYDCGDLTVYGGNIEAIAYMYGVGIGGNSLSLQHSYINTNIYNPIKFKTDEKTFNGGDGGNVKVYNGNLSVKAAGAVGIGGGNGTYFYVEYNGYVKTNKNFKGGNGGTFAYYGGTVTVESDLAAFGKGLNGYDSRDNITDSDMTAFTSTKDGVYGALAGDNLSELKKEYNFDDKVFRLNGEKCVQFGKYGHSYTEALNPTCETAGHKAYLLRTADDLYYEEGGFNVAIGNDDSALQAWISEGGDGYIAPLGHDWVYINENQHKCVHCEKTELHTMEDDGCTKCNGFYYNYSSETHTFEKKAIPSGTKLLPDFDGNYTLPEGWYLVHADVTAEERITCTGDVHLILENGCNFTANKGIELATDVSLSVYAQSLNAEEMGNLTVPYSPQYCAGIGSNRYVTCGNISIHGGVITAAGSSYAAEIGSGYQGSCGNISVYGGVITVNGGLYAAGIGSGGIGSCINISICGGDITATGGRQGSGIGSGDRGSCSNISICGGNITATGGWRAAGIGSGDKGSCINISICGGNITATGGEEAVGIGSGYEASCESVAISDYLDITAGADKDSAKPVAAYNGEKYVHTVLKTARKEPTCTQNGHIEYYKKDGKNYSDKDCTNEITDLEKWLSATEVNGGGMLPATGHSFTYTVSGHTVTAKCSGCNAEKSITLTVPESAIYDGSEKTATFEGRDEFVALTGASVGKILYSEDGTNYSENAPVNAGKYNVKATVAGEVMIATFTINKAYPAVDDFSFTPPENCECDGQPKNATVFTEKEGMGNITVKYQKDNGGDWDVTLTDAPTEPGKYKVAIYVSEGENYRSSDLITSDGWVFEITESVLTVQKKDASCTENGHIEYYKKDGKNYSDKDCTKEITDLDEWLKTPETDGGGMIQAKGHTWESFSDYEHRCKVCYELKEHTAGDDYICTDCGHGVLHLAKADAIKAINEAAGDSTDMFVTALVNAAVAEINKEATDTVAKVIEIKNKGIAAIEKQLGGTSTHTHTFADTYSHNDTHHWHVCTCEDEKCKNLVDGFAVHTFTVVTNDDGSKTYTCACGYTKTVYEGGSTEGEPVQGVVKCDGISLTLSSDIYINFYMQLTDEALANGKMVFTIGNRTVEGVTAQLNESNGRYYFACPLNALEMAETVKAEFTYGSTTYTQTYSVKKYIETILTATDKDGKFVYTEKEQELARKIANYGYYAQLYLESIHTNVTIGGENGYKEMLGDFKDYISTDDALNLTDRFTASPDTANLTFDGRTVYFDSATALNFYVITKDGKAPTATCDKGKTVEIKKYSGNTYIVSVKDITATELADTYTVTVSHGGDTIKLKGSVLDYCAAVMNAHRNKTADKDVKAVNAMAAFYEYYDAAVKYVTAASK